MRPVCEAGYWIEYRPHTLVGVSHLKNYKNVNFIRKVTNLNLIAAI